MNEAMLSLIRGRRKSHKPKHQIVWTTEYRGTTIDYVVERNQLVPFAIWRKPKVNMILSTTKLGSITTISP